MPFLGLCIVYFIYFYFILYFILYFIHFLFLPVNRFSDLVRSSAAFTEKDAVMVLTLLDKHRNNATAYLKDAKIYLKQSSRLSALEVSEEIQDSRLSALLGGYCHGYGDGYLESAYRFSLKVRLLESRLYTALKEIDSLKKACVHPQSREKASSRFHPSVSGLYPNNPFLMAESAVCSFYFGDNLEITSSYWCNTRARSVSSRESLNEYKHMLQLQAELDAELQPSAPLESVQEVEIQAETNPNSVTNSGVDSSAASAGTSVSAPAAASSASESMF